MLSANKPCYWINHFNKSTNCSKLRSVLTLAVVYFIPILTFANSACGNFYLDKTWPTRSVASLEFFGSGVAVDNKNNVLLLHRGHKMRTEALNLTNEVIDDDVVLILDTISGKIKARWGRGKFVKPHGIEISGEGDLFVTDVRLHQVFKFKYDKKTSLWEDEPVFSLGERGISGNDRNHFCSPADVAIMPKINDFFVADGYCNSRIVKFNKHGTYLDEFHSGSSQPMLPSTAFNITHAVAVATPCKLYGKSSFPIIFVADRNNGRIQTFSENGTFLYEIAHENFANTKEMLLSFAFSQRGCSLQFYGTLYAVNGHLPMGQPKVFQMLVSSESYKLVSSFSVSNISKGTTEKMRTETPHDIAISENGQVLYIVEAYENLTLKKFVFSRSSYLRSALLWHCVLAITICLFT